jgi:hypothetical protein
METKYASALESYIIYELLNGGTSVEYLSSPVHD